MNKKNLVPQQTQPVNRIITGQLSTDIAELSEEVLSNTAGASASIDTGIRIGNENGSACFSPVPWICSYDGDDAE